MEKRKTINEEKSISNIVKEESIRLYNTVVDDFFKNSDKGKIYQSQANNHVFNTNTIKYDVSKIDQELGTIDVEYYIYRCKTYDDYLIIFNQNLDLNSGFDYDTKRMVLVGFYVDDSIYPDLKSTIYHELTHLFQYSNGMEKRVGLYEKCMEFLKDGFGPKYVVGALTYYTFPHEQDAMTHQFYADLMSTETNYNLDDCIMRYSEYRNMKTCLDYLKEHRDEMLPFVRELGMSYVEWKKRVFFAKKRFLNKLNNAFVKYSMDRKPLGESSIKTYMRRLLFLTENEKHFGPIEFFLESFYSKYSM